MKEYWIEIKKHCAQQNLKPMRQAKHKSCGATHPNLIQVQWFKH
jgi:hypothetical protein